MPRSSTKPNHIKRLEGNRGRRKLPPDIIAPGALPPAPAHLTDGQKARWGDIVRSLPAAMLAGADEAAVERAAVAWDAFRAVTEEINQGVPFVVENDVGSQTVNPLFTVRQRLEKAMSQSAFELGLSPLARSRLANTQKVEADPYETLIGPNGLAWTDYGQAQ